MYHVICINPIKKKERFFLFFFCSDRSSSWARRMLRCNTNKTELKQIIISPLGRMVNSVRYGHYRDRKFDSRDRQIFGKIPKYPKYL